MTESTPDGALAFPMARVQNDRAELASLKIQRQRQQQQRHQSSPSSSRRPRQQRQRSPQPSLRSYSYDDGRSADPDFESHHSGSIYSRTRSQQRLLDPSPVSVNERRRGPSPQDWDEEQHEHEPSSSSKLLPPNVLLSPRADVWIYLCASSFVGVASLGRAHARYSSEVEGSSSKMAANIAINISLLAINASLSLGVGIAYRVRPSAMNLTRPIRALGNYSAELPLAVFSMLLWIICIILYNTPKDPAFQVMMEMPFAPNDWNANFFYSLWITGILSMYLVADLCTGNMGAMTMTASSMSFQRSTEQKIARYWLLLFFRSLLLLVIALMESTSPMCGEQYLQDTPYCASATVSLMCSILAITLCILYAALTRFWPLTPYTKVFIERALAMTILVGYALNAGITTSPGGSGANVGNVFVASWLVLILALILNVNYLGQNFRSSIISVPPPPPPRSTNGGSSRMIAPRSTNGGSSRMMTMSKREELKMFRKSSENDEDSEHRDDYYSEEDDDDEPLPQLMFRNNTSDNSMKMLPYKSSPVVSEHEGRSKRII